MLLNCAYPLQSKQREAINCNAESFFFFPLLSFPLQVSVRRKVLGVHLDTLGRAHYMSLPGD